MTHDNLENMIVLYFATFLKTQGIHRIANSRAIAQKQLFLLILEVKTQCKIDKRKIVDLMCFVKTNGFQHLLKY